MAKPYPVHYVSREELANSQCWTCVVCSERWPEKRMRFQDGIESDRRCPNCYEDGGGTIARNLDRAAAADIAARITEQYAAPPRFPGWFDETDAVVVLTTFTPEPRRLTRGGASETLTIKGSGLATTDTIEYGHAGITNASAAALTPVTYDGDGNPESPYEDTLVLTVHASGAVPVGLYSLTYNDVVYRNVFDVRD
jgi:hypothetical protein